MISPIHRSPYGHGRWVWPGTLAGRRAAGTGELVALRAGTEADARLAITTDEGDTVTISLHSEADTGAVFYDRKGARNAAGVTAGSVTTSVTRDLAVSIQGDLNDQELADVRRLLSRIERVVRSFLDGDLAAAARLAPDGGGLESLSGYSLSLESTRSLTMLRATAPAPATGSPSESATAPAESALPFPATGSPRHVVWETAES
jgi:hypothetical protein